jgi:tetratricopeptide (TPR) repeat protein
MGRYGEGRRLVEECLAIARERGDTTRVAAALQPLAMACSGMGDMEAARRHSREAVELARSVGNAHQLVSAVNALGQLERIERNFDAAESHYQQVIAMAREQGDQEIVAIGLLNLAMVAVERGASERVPGLLLEILTLADAVGSKPVGQSALEVSAGLAAVHGDHERALRYFGAAEAETGSTGLQRDPADDAFLRPLVARSRDALGAEAAREAEQEGLALSYERAIDEVRRWLAEAEETAAVTR